MNAEFLCAVMKVQCGKGGRRIIHKAEQLYSVLEFGFQMGSLI